MDDYILAICSGRAAWQVEPTSPFEIDLSKVAKNIITSGWECTLENRLCYTFSGDVDLTLFPSGKLLIKTGDRELADNIAKLHIENWLC
ncbi:MAG TPA: hypothetical protein QF621_03055 [Candidatus Thalassarchaeaceae archaeon]|jgi:hypothetical protein|nr:hypothetical protein [Candidatus Thalassarchaeaceae archaeon]HJM87392.1 hypothetical protein [Candidatus Thalassarchaeaceae archaeon]|tara:strand:- start:84 stop:350 length:267 start_codon:yes stop_codon:yes gene_type:complete